MKGARTGKGAGVSTLTPLLSSREWSLRKHLWGGPWLPRDGVIKGVKGEKLQGREGHGMQSGASRSLSCKGGGVGGLSSSPCKARMSLAKNVTGE